MLTDTALRSKVDSLWDKLWAGGLPNPLDAIEQLSFLLFLKRLDEREQDAERAARLRDKAYQPIFPDPELRWSYWTQLPADQALRHVKEKVFPFVKTLGGVGGSFALQMANAEFKINKPSLLIEATKAIDEMQISSQNQDVQGDLYEYLLSKLNTAGQNGQFRTPRHIIRMMVKLVDPHPGERVCDPAAGTCGFLVNAYQHILETHTRPDNLTYDEDGYPHHLIGDQLSAEEHEFLQTKAFTGYDNDSGMTMLRIGCMNMMLHGIESPTFRYADTLSKAFNEERIYDVVLANPPFKGAIDSADVNPTLPTKCKKTEILFLHLFVRLLENGGRAAAIAPDGVLFGSSRAHVEIRKKLIEENRLDAVVSMPSGVFRPYAGVSTAVLVFTKGAGTDRIWFYDMEHDGFSLDDKRQKVAENDIPDLVECWKNRRDVKFQQNRAQRLAELDKQIAPLKADRLQHQATIHRLRFEEVIAADGNADKAREAREKAETELAELQAKIAPLQQEINQLGRQFWVSKDQVKANKYDLSASRYRHVEQEEVFYEQPEVTVQRLNELAEIAGAELKSLLDLLSRGGQ
jgi:type I restriction enzyme M protein